MKHSLLRAALAFFVLYARFAFPQDNTQSADCTFDDGKQMSIRYNDVDAKKSPPNGKAWSPGDKSTALFTQTDLTIGNSTIPAAAYSVYLIPGPDAWTLVINKNVKPDAAYDQKQDVARVQMQVAPLSSPAEKLKLAMAKMGPKQCNLRVYYGKTATYGAEFKEK
jgi:DUF2911 family protein